MKDHAVEEIRDRRRKLIKEQYGGSIGRLIEEAMAWEKRHADRCVDPRKRRRSVTAIH